jgi:HAD superfamily phosphoserine phosphatase-like hydrolase
LLHQYSYWLCPPEDPQLVSAASTVAVMDFDNTLARGWIVGSWLARLSEANVGNADAGVMRLTALFEAYAARPGFGHDRLATEAGQIYSDAMAGVSVTEVRALASPFVADYVGPRGRLFRQSRALITGLRSRGLRPILVTGAPGEVTQELMRELNVESCFPFLLEIQDGVYTGQIVCNRGVSTEKASTCKWLVDEQEAEIVVAIGDSAGDRPMWRSARLSIKVGDTATGVDAEVDVDGLDLDAELSQEFWSRVPESSWMSFVRPPPGGAIGDDVIRQQTPERHTDVG